ncbi:hypothetical protein NL676_031677 [Syzygium grande]|nr:hypothetical protein NL676_031677 [Syzygium grande]
MTERALDSKRKSLRIWTAFPHLSSGQRPALKAAHSPNLKLRHEKSIALIAERRSINTLTFELAVASPRCKSSSKPSSSLHVNEGLLRGRHGAGGLISFARELFKNDSFTAAKAHDSRERDGIRALNQGSRLIRPLVGSLSWDPTSCSQLMIPTLGASVQSAKDSDVCRVYKNQVLTE